MCFTQMTVSKHEPDQCFDTSMFTFSNIHYFSFILFLSKHMIHINMYCIYRIGSPRLSLSSLFQVNRFTVPFLVQLQILVLDNYTYASDVVDGVQTEIHWCLFNNIWKWVDMFYSVIILCLQ